MQLLALAPLGTEQTDRHRLVSPPGRPPVRGPEQPAREQMDHHRPPEQGWAPALLWAPRALRAGREPVGRKDHHSRALREPLAELARRELARAREQKDHPKAREQWAEPVPRVRVRRGLELQGLELRELEREALAPAPRGLAVRALALPLRALEWLAPVPPVGRARALPARPAVVRGGLAA